MAAGEVACASVHGANRLGANSLLDIVVFGRATANFVKENYKPGLAHKPLRQETGEAAVANIDRILHGKSNTERTADVRMKMQKTMQRHAAVFRKQDLLDEGVKKMEDIYPSINHLRVEDKSLIWYDHFFTYNSSVSSII